MEQILKGNSGQLIEFRLPRWEQLPDMELYMDQVISQLDKYLAPLQSNTEEHFVTPSMVNNYVKQQLLPPPIKKKYSRIHMAHLVLICILKQVLTIPEVKVLLHDKLTMQKHENMGFAYDSFCVSQEKALAKLQDSSLLDENSSNFALDATVLACAGKALAQKLIREKQQPAEKKHAEKSSSKKK